jgi:hypothetical protein
MLIAKGFSVSFKLTNGKMVRAPGGYGLLHDPSGKDWPKCSGLVASFSKGGGEIDDRLAKDYFGHAPREGELSLPPRALSAWKKVGAVAEILYTRRRPGRLLADHQDEYFHPFEKGTPTLYRRGRMLRLELGPNCEWSWRGVVRP